MRVGQRYRSALLLSTALTAASLPAHAQPAPNAQPSGGHVVAGSAQISQSSSTTTVQQASARAAVNWTSFDVGSQQTVTFRQPSADAVTLNRVTGPDPSAIAGKINANGQIILTNPSGVVFYRGAEVNAQSVVISAPGITNRNFMAGHMVFDQAAHPNATIANAGTITVRQTGLAALVAPHVANSGVISAKLGHAVLAGAEADTLDVYGDGLVAVDVTKQVTQAPGGKQALVTNSGTILADGGQILLTAAAVDGVVSKLVEAGGKLRANSLGNRAGTIAVNGTGGAVLITGSLTAMGNSGGNIELNADQAVLVGKHAVIDASGRTGGGNVAIGTTLERAIGGPSVTPSMTAARTKIAAGAQIHADARQSGTGGRVTVLSTQSTALGGTITARGGSTGGNGGTIEVSTAGVLSLEGSIDVAALHGRLGNILLDPGTLDISATGSPVIAPGSGTITATQGGSTGVSYVRPSALNSLTGNIQLEAVSDINVLSSVNLTTSGQSFELDAGGNLNVRAPITTNGVIKLVAGSALSPTPTLSAALSVQAALTSGGNAIYLSGGTGGIGLAANVNAGAGAVGLYSQGGITQTAGVITARALGGYAKAGSVALTQPNAIGALYNFTTTGGDFALHQAAGQTLSIGGTVAVSGGYGISLQTDALTFAANSDFAPALTASGGTLSIAPVTAGRPILLTSSYPTSTSTGTLRLDGYFFRASSAAQFSIGSVAAGNITVGLSGDVIVPNSNALSLSSGGVITQGAPLSVASLSGTAQGITLANTGNTIGAFGNLTAAGATNSAITLANSGSIYLTGSVTAPALSLTTYGVISQGASSSLNVTRLDSSGASTLSLGGANTIGTLGNNYVFSFGPSFISINNAAALSVVGTESAQSSVSGGGSVILSANSPIAIAATGVINATGTIALSTSSSITEAIGGVLTGGPLTRLTGSASSAALTSPSNSLANLGSFAVTGASGSFALTDGTVLTVIDTVSVPSGGQVSLVDDALSIGPGSIVAPGGGVSLAPLTTGHGVEVIASGAANPAALSLSVTSLDQISTGTLTLGTASGGPIHLGNLTGTTVDTIDLRRVATTLNLLSAGTIDQGGVSGFGTITGGGVLVGTLSGQAASAFLPGVNTIATLGSFATTNGISLVDAGALLVAGPVTDLNGVFLSAVGNLTISGVVSAPQVTLSAPSGAILQASGATAFTAGTLTATGQTISLAGLSNTISNIASLTATGAGITLFNTTSLTVAGPIAASGDVTLNTGGAITVGAGIYATGGNIVITQSSGTLSLAAPVEGGNIALTVPGSITELTGAYLAASGTLSGSASLLNAAVRSSVSNLGSFTAPLGITLVNAAGLAVSGPLSSAGTIALQAAGPLTLAGSIAGAAVFATTKTGRSTPDITQTGGAVDATGAISLTSAGSVSQSGGGLTAANLAITAAGSVSLPGTANLIATLGSVSSIGGFTLANAEPLSVTAGVSDHSAILLEVTGALSIGSTVAAPSIDLVATGAISEPAGGALLATTLTGSAGSAALIQSANTIGNLSGFVSAGSFTLTDAAPLTIAGRNTVGAGLVLDINDDTPSFASGGTLAAIGGTVVLAPGTLGDAFTLSGIGAVSAGTLVIGATTAGAVDIAGAIALPAGTIALLSSSTVSETGSGALSAAALTGSAAFASLTGGNSIANLGSFSTTTGITFVNTGPLSVAGPVTDLDGVSLSAVGNLTIPGSISAPQVTLSAPSGAILQAAGASAFTAGTLTATGQTISLAGLANTIGNIAGLTATGAGITLFNTASLTLAGPVSAAGDVTLNTGGALSLAARVTGGNIALTAPGSITETTGGYIGASGTLSGSTGLANLSAGNDIVSLGKVTAPLGITLVNAAPLAVSGPLSSVGTVALQAAGPLTLAGSITGGAVLATTTTGNITQTGGAVDATGAIGLSSAGSVLQSGGGLTAANLAITAAGSVSLPGTANLIATLGSVSSIGGFTLANAEPLSVTAGVSDHSAILLEVTGALSIGSTVAAPSIDLVATGAISEPAGGALLATTLTGSAGSAALIQSANTIGTLSGFVSAGSFTLTDAAPLTIAGNNTVGAGLVLDINDDTPSFASGGTLTAIGGTVVLAPGTLGDAFTLSGIGAVSAGTLVIGATTAGAIDIAGSIALPGGVIELLSSSAISETTGGGLTAGLLSGSGGATSLSGANTIAALGGFTSTGSFALTDTGPLSLSGSLVAGSVALTVSGTLGEAAGGAISAATLSGSAASATLSGPNSLATLGSFTTGSGFALTDGSALSLAGPLGDGRSIALNVSGPLALAGPVSAPSLSLSATGAITQTAGLLTGSTLSVASGGAVNLASLANDIAALGTVSAPAGFTLATFPDLAINGPLISGGSVSLTASDISEGPAGSITAPLLNLSAHTLANFTTGTLALGGTNTIASLGTVTTANLTLNNSGGLTIAGPVNGLLIQVPETVGPTSGSVSVTASGPISVTGSISTPSLSMGTAGSLSITGTIAAGSMTATAAGAISESAGGSITAGQLAISGQAVTLGGANSIASLGTVSAANFTLNDSAGLTVGGKLTGDAILLAAGSIAIAGTIIGESVGLTSAGPISETGTIASHSLSVSAASAMLTGNNSFDALAAVATTGSFVVDDSGFLTVTGPVSAGAISLQSASGIAIAGSLTSTSIVLNSGLFPITESAVITPLTGLPAGPDVGGVLETGSITATSLSASGPSIALTGTNTIASLGNLSASGFISIASTGALSVSGPVSAPGLTVSTTGPLNLAGTITAGTLSATASGGIVQSAGSLSAGILTGSAGGAVQLGVGGIAAIGTLGAFSVAGAPLTVTSSIPMSVSGPVSATTLSLAAPVSLTLNGGTLTIGGAEAAGSTLTVTADPAFVQTAITTIQQANANSPATLTISLPNGGTASFNDLIATGTPVTLALGDGSASGTINVGALHIIGSGGAATLFGTVDTVGGPSAALISAISPASAASYTFNGCIIAAVSCTTTIIQQPVVVGVLPDTILPPNAYPGSYLPLPFANDILSFMFSQDLNDPDLVLPNISDRDY